MPDGATNGRRVLAGVPGTRFGRIEWFSDIDSTNERALACARDGAPDGVVVVADHQTAGRGRLGRVWHAPRGGSLLATLLLRPVLPVEDWPLAGTAVALAAVDAVASVCDLPARVKWPNDVLVRGRKLAGVLAEADPAHGVVVVGMGLNVDWGTEVPPELESLATAVSFEGGRLVAREVLLATWLARCEHWLRIVERARDGAALLRWSHRARSATIGTRVRVERADGTIVGTAIDLTQSGHLLIDADAPSGALVEVTVGDVVHLRPG